MNAVTPSMLSSVRTLSAQPQLTELVVSGSFGSDSDKDANKDKDKSSFPMYAIAGIGLLALLLLSRKK